MTIGAGQTSTLFFHRQQVLKRPERQRDQREYLVQIEVPHLGLDQLDVGRQAGDLVFKPFAANAQHLSGEIEALDFHAGPGGRYQYAAGPATKLENRAAGMHGDFNKKIYVRSVTIWLDMIVELGDSGIVLTHDPLPHRSPATRTVNSPACRIDLS